MRKLAILNQKGGVGKTTTAVNLSHALAIKGYMVTSIDLDPQGHMCASFGVESMNGSGVDDVILNKASITDKSIVVRERLRLVPCGSELGKIEHITHNGVKLGSCLKDAMEGNFSDQDFIVMDCPPSSGIITVNALFSADEIIVPVVGDYLSLQGVSYLMGTLKNFNKYLKHLVKIWIVITRYHTRRRLPQDIFEKLVEYFPGMVLCTKVRETASLAESPSFGKTIFEYRNKSNGAHDYNSLADDIILHRVI